VTEADAIIVAGVATALAGSLVAAPDGAFLIVRQAINDIRKALHWISHPGQWRRRHINAEGGLRVSAAARASGEGTVQVIRNPHTPVEEQLRQLWKAVDRLEERAGHLERELKHADERLSSAIKRVSENVSAARAAFDALLEERERKAATIDARGLPLVGLGIVMTGVPDYLAAWGWPGWLVISVAGALVIWLALVPFASWLVRAVQGATG
jgi:hypothetical protein